VRIEPAGGGLLVTNRYEVLDTAGVALTWSLLRDGAPVATGPLGLPVVAAGEHVTLALPDEVAACDPDAEWWLAVEARRAVPWAAESAVVGRGQVPLTAPVVRHPRTVAPARRVDDGWTVGLARFDRDGTLRRLGSMDIEGAGLGAWRPPTENDRARAAGAARSNAEAWALVGLDRLTRRIDGVALTADGRLVVRERVAGAGTTCGFVVTSRWAGTERGLSLTMDVEPQGPWPCALPRLGYSFALPCPDPQAVRWTWFGNGPGESYPDSQVAARIGRWSGTVEELNPAYVVPQESGCRRRTRRAHLAGPGVGLEVVGLPWLDLTVRAWSNEEIARARHRYELPRPDRLWVHLDVGQDGLGSATCGPGVAPDRQFRPGPARLEVLLGVADR
jgi:beta-galactosidase